LHRVLFTLRSSRHTQVMITTAIKATICKTKAHLFPPCVDLFNGHQQDAQEAASAFLGSLQIMLKRPPSQSVEYSSSDSESDPEEIFKAQQNSVINDYLLGFFSSAVSCRNCGDSRTTTDAFCIVSLPIPITAAKEVCTIDHCLRFFQHLKLPRRRT